MARAAPLLGVLTVVCSVRAFIPGNSVATRLVLGHEQPILAGMRSRARTRQFRAVRMSVVDTDTDKSDENTRMERRKVLHGLSSIALGTIVGTSSRAEAFGDYGAHKFEFLSNRATMAAGSDFENPGFGYDACFGLCSDKQLYYPSWLQGEWDVESTYAEKAFPKGEQFVYRNLRGGSARSATEKIGDTTKFAAKYIPAKTGGTVLGFGAGEQAVISDRAFNTMEMLNAYAGYGRILRVDYSPDSDPTRMVMQYPSLGPDMQPLPPKRTEVFINNRDFAISPDRRSFACSEVFRAVTLGPGQSAVADSENVSLFRMNEDGTVSSRQRSLVYLVPSPNSREGDLYMQVGAKAVAVYDYSVTMRPRATSR